MRLVLIDPAQQVPYYDRELAAALVAAGVRVSVLSEPLHHYDAGPWASAVDVRGAFGRLLRGPLGLRLESHAPIRRLARAITYGPELVTVVRWLRSSETNAVHWQWSLLPAAEVAAFHRLRQSRLPIVFTAHNVLPHEARPWLSPRQLARLYRTVDRIIVHSAASRSRLLALFPTLDASHVEVIPMAPPTNVERLPREEAKARLDLPPDRPMVLHFGHIRPYKGVDVLLAAASEVRRQVPGSLFVIAGAMAGGARAAAALQRQVAKACLEETVWIRPGYVPHPRVAAYLSAADAVALPYRQTDDSAVVLLCRAYRRPVVATAVGGLPETLALGGGILVPPGDVPALAEALVRVLSDAGLRGELADQAEAAAGAWTWADVARHHVAVYETLRGDCR